MNTRRNRVIVVLTAGIAALVVMSGGTAFAERPAPPTTTTSSSAAPTPENPPAQPLAHDHGAPGVTPLARDCGQTIFDIHDGFQEAPACVTTAMGEVSTLDNNPTLLIVGAPKAVRAGDNIELKVSTRNLVRDRFLAAGAGGYYLETGLLNDAGLTRGHFHTACRVIADENNAPAPARQDSFVATEDGAGGATPDTVTVTLPPLAQTGTAQCAAWAGDGSHRMPMMQFANEIPAFDTVDVKVKRERDGDTAEPPRGRPGRRGDG